MITAKRAGLRFEREPTGHWRHWGDTFTVRCDARGCGATIEVRGLEHNGAEVECVYLPRPEGDGWRLAERDLCPIHVATRTKPTIPQVRDRFAAYHARHPAWGSLHVVMADGNVSDDSVRWAMAHAAGEGDEEAMDLALVLLAMSRTQRSKLARVVGD